MRVSWTTVRRVAASCGLVSALGFAWACADGSAATTRQETTKFDADRAWAQLEAQVAFGPRPAGSGALVKTLEHLESQLKSYGLAPVRESFIARNTPAGDVPMCNLYVDLPAAGPDAAQAPMVVIGSHFDTKNMRDFAFVGANDGASSTAVLLELARVLAADGPRRVAYRLLFLDGEEAIRPNWQDPDNCYGSRHHTAELKSTGLLSRVKAFVLLDMVGDKELRLHRDQFSDSWLYESFAAPARAAGLGKHVDGPREPISDDHVPFLESGVPSVDLIDFTYGPNNAYWHTADDTSAHCSRESLKVIGEIVLMGLPNVEKRLLGK